MKKTLSIILLLLFSGSASAVEFEGSVGAVSNYVWRGITQTDSNPAVQGSIGLTTESGLYVNAWGSQVDYGNDTTAEVDFTVGFSKAINDTISLDVGYIKYSYLQDEVDFADDIAEVYGTLSIGPVSGSVYRDFDNETNYYRGTVTPSAFMEDAFVDVSGFVGRNDNSDRDVGIIISKDIKGINISYMFTDTNAEVEDDSTTHSIGLFYNF